jgi:hypothetical protein
MGIIVASAVLRGCEGNNQVTLAYNVGYLRLLQNKYQQMHCHYHTQ